MLILAIDTTGEMGGVGIYRDAECLALVPSQGPGDGYSIILFEMVEQALAQAHVELRQIDLYAVANGPGSFTGIRVGLAAARAWGKVFTRPVRAVSVLEAMVGKMSLQPDWAFPIIDARRGEFFLGCFRRNSSEPSIASRQDYEPVDTGWILKPEPLRAFIDERLTTGASATCVVRAHDQAAVGLHAGLPPSLNWQSIEGALVDSIAAIARKEEQSSRPCPDTKLDAYYLRRPDAEINWKG
ncbi:MAG: tRNA (adenosine(37)-N6)-threonylcarbamoyltransferase complex dimerization subunit type 1 TsaB [Acidobacteriota bacterium]|nr:tRNA (adenosine(37)-N6)-threonylcarbamoyltransferase complex dimerization subunit type 1 TsaB [Acidobacteriota bacterium]